ncbi:polysaccharide deacetylase family protein [Psychromonas sp. MME2]|uniref:polysaccharide deacetylase family protein n=1 Tax=unclassified Psychromonas TaxID=2614957 RepID=UPI00339CADE2
MDLIKTLLLQLIFKLGIFSLFHYLNRHNITILYLHSIFPSDHSPLPSWQPLRTPHNSKDLDFTLKTLNQHYQFISLTTALNILQKKIPPINNGLVITLDDGYYNNIDAAATIFANYAIYPTIFVATKHTENNIPFWFDRLDYALQQIEESTFTSELLHHPFTFDCSSRQALKQSYALFRNRIKLEFKCDTTMRDYLEKLSIQIEQYTGKALSQIIEQDNHAKLASWQQLKQAQQQFDFEVGSHTVNHARLALVANNIAETELSESKRHIEGRLKTPCDTFCYPDNSYNESTEKLVNKYYQCALTTDAQLNKIGQNMMRLKRFNFPTDKNPLKILFKISALRQFLQNNR